MIIRESIFWLIMLFIMPLHVDRPLLFFNGTQEGNKEDNFITPSIHNKDSPLIKATTDRQSLINNCGQQVSRAST